MRLILSLTLVTSMLTTQIKSKALEHFASIVKCVSICAQDPNNKECVENAVCEMVTSVINFIDSARIEGVNISAEECKNILNKMDDSHRTALLKVFEEEPVKRSPKSEECTRKIDCKKEEIKRSPESEKASEETERGCCKKKCKNNCSTTNNCNSCCRTEEETKNDGGECGGGSCKVVKPEDCKDGVCTIKRSPEDCKKEELKKSPENQDEKKNDKLTRSPQENGNDIERGCCKKLKCKCTSCTGSTCTGCCCK